MQWGCVGFVSSGLLYGVFSTVAILFEQRDPQEPLPAASSFFGLAGYGIFHWLFLGLLTLPFLIAPILLWPRISRTWPRAENSWCQMLLFLGLLSALAIALRLFFLEHPVILAHGPSTVIGGDAVISCLALWLGLSIPRLILPGLKPGGLEPGARRRTTSR